MGLLIRPPELDRLPQQPRQILRHAVQIDFLERFSRPFIQPHVLLVQQEHVIPPVSGQGRQQRLDVESPADMHSVANRRREPRRSQESFRRKHGEALAVTPPERLIRQQRHARDSSSRTRTARSPKDTARRSLSSSRSRIRMCSAPDATPA